LNIPVPVNTYPQIFPIFLSLCTIIVEENTIRFSKLDFCLTVHHQLGKVIQMNQLDATMIY